MGAQPSWISKTLLEEFEARNFHPKFRGSTQQHLEYANLLQQELNQGIIIETDKIMIYNPSFLAKRPDVRYRKILDYKQINQLTRVVHFKMDGVIELAQLLDKGDYATTLDIKDAFLHIKVSKALQPYFGFHFLTRSFTYRALSFGYRRSPYIFTKTLAIAI
ncbi:MAG: hypothetical protein EZS28_041288 [Streblomastix strix]|uniref:Reverse transcriptase domain-containing protein n=1 Tax=Streblomastix strix TaxID=222440 RepID=A0A5J4TXG6_9EUKA|nr:MAG: hypothetical protein EZS28_041288 [Streblomastix strix]